MIPEVSPERIRDALAQFDDELRDADEWASWEARASHRYAIAHNGKMYPPKQIIRMATGFTDFSGGVEANTYLEKAGFQVVPIRPTATTSRGLRAAIEAIIGGYSSARSAKLSKTHPVCAAFAEAAQGLRAMSPVVNRPNIEVAWSVGQGNWARVPWIALLDRRETTSTQRGIYCVILFREDMSGFYLTFNQGVTEPKQRLGTRSGKEFLRERAAQLRERALTLGRDSFTLDDAIDLHTTPGLGADYELSTIAYKFYEATAVPDDSQLERDVESLLAAYDDYLSGSAEAVTQVRELPRRRGQLADVAADFAAALRRAHVDFGEHHDQLVRAFVASLVTKRLVILTGLSGSGKTQIAIRLGEFLGRQLQVEAVRPDWTGSEAIFGFEDALRPGTWHAPRALEFMLEAASAPHRPYVLVLDEMNLAHVERYFADLLSGVESGHPVLPNLSRSEESRWAVAEGAIPRIPIPRNLFIIGTVNVDETTYMFSPKVLDRANVFEFRVRSADLHSAYRKPIECDEGYPEVVQTFLSLALDDDFHSRQRGPAAKTFEAHLRALHGLLSRTGFEFGHRVFYEAIRFAAMFAAAGEPDPVAALDRQVMQKILPRLHGSRRRLEPTLSALGRFAWDLQTDYAVVEGDATFDPFSLDETEARLPISFEKIRRMLRSLRANQFASFTE